MLSRQWGWVLALCGVAAAAQTSELQPLAPFPMRQDGPVLRGAVRSGEPFTVAGPRGVLVGQQQGVLEAWLLPVKLLSHLTIQADVEGYPVPLDLNSMAREIEVRPDRTIITYSHIAVVVRQIMFAPEDAQDGTGAVVLFQVDAVRPVELTLRFTADLKKMWPAPSSGSVSPEWISTGRSGWYMLHGDFPDVAGAIALPGATSGVMAPYQERPQEHPLELHLKVDPKQDRGRFYPLLMAVGHNAVSASRQALWAKLVALDEHLPELYRDHLRHYTEEEAQQTRIVTPDPALNEDFAWATTSIGQLRTRTADGGTALVAGYYASGDSARPGFGWFFGRDALYTLFAVHSYGDFALSRQELEFLMQHQREDGKIMHEYSQTASQVDWAALPYQYAAADATPLFLLAMLDYVRASGDTTFVTAHRDNITRAWRFETSHDADRDGIYDNSEGTGWVESWPPGMPKQEIYLASLDEQASRAMQVLQQLLGDAAGSSSAATRAEKIHQTIEREYLDPATGRYAFSWNKGTPDRTNTVYPAIAWWTRNSALDHPDASLREWSSARFDTDWGLRDISNQDPMYDPISYHQGSVWPLFTGWTALAQYRAGRPLAGYIATMQNAGLTRAQDPGAVTELLSGDFFEPFGRSTSHQLWSSAMVIVPILRGMFGIEVDALQHTVSVSPHLPADWDHATVEQLHVGDSVASLSFLRAGGNMIVSIKTSSGPKLRLQGAADNGTLKLPLPPVEISVPYTLPVRGSRTTQMKVLNETTNPRSVVLEQEAPGGTTEELGITLNQPVRLSAEGAELVGNKLRVNFGPPTDGYVPKTVTIRW